MLREEAINLIDINRSNLKATNEEGFSKDIEALDMAIKALEQEPKTGHWISSPNDCFAHCSECGLHGDKGIYKHYKYCPNCGEKKESEDR